ncbi:hypothetical protein BGX38DRAFT_1139135 [Terfezia claveryi]|nr:hypothetical protein BGX38DRAFT_1139135 [Terfezia claveryi]
MRYLVPVDMNTYFGQCLKVTKPGARLPRRCPVPGWPDSKLVGVALEQMQRDLFRRQTCGAVCLAAQALEKQYCSPRPGGVVPTGPVLLNLPENPSLKNHPSPLIQRSKLPSNTCNISDLDSTPARHPPFSLPPPHFSSMSDSQASIAGPLASAINNPVQAMQPTDLKAIPVQMGLFAHSNFQNCFIQVNGNPFTISQNSVPAIPPPITHHINVPAGEVRFNPAAPQLHSIAGAARPNPAATQNPSLPEAARLYPASHVPSPAGAVGLDPAAPETFGLQAKPVVSTTEVVQPSASLKENQGHSVYEKGQRDALVRLIMYVDQLGKSTADKLQDEENRLCERLQLTAGVHPHELLLSDQYDYIFGYLIEVVMTRKGLY